VKFNLFITSFVSQYFSSIFLQNNKTNFFLKENQIKTTNLYFSYISVVFVEFIYFNLSIPTFQSSIFPTKEVINLQK